MNLSLNLRTRTQIVDAVALEFDTQPCFEAVVRALAAEHLRSAIYYNSAPFGDSSESALLHSGRLTALLKRNLGILWSNETGGIDPSEVFRSVLQDLGKIGDIVSAKGGYWMPTPIRLVRCGDDSSFIVLGGAPRDVIGAMLGTIPTCVGAGRYVKAGDVNNGDNEEIVQTFDDWTGAREPLRDWTARTIALYASRLAESDGLKTDQVEIYGPDIFRDMSRMGRWISAKEVGRKLDGLRLFRPTLAHSRSYDQPYYLGDFVVRNGAVLLNRSIRVDFEVSRRLRFGLDDQLGTPRVVALKIDDPTVELDMPFSLPAPEAKVLSLGWNGQAISSAKNTKTILPRAALPAVYQALKGLLINFTTALRST